MDSVVASLKDRWHGLGSPFRRLTMKRASFVTFTASASDDTVTVLRIVHGRRKILGKLLNDQVVPG